MTAILGNVVALLLVGVLVFVCGRNVVNQIKSGGCAGCSGGCNGHCSGCSSCGTEHSTKK